MLEVRGRVLVYTIVSCPHCLAAKKTLKDLGVPFIDVPVERFPAVRSWLQEKTGKTSVPQIFFNETYVGGNDNLQKIVKDEEEWGKLIADIQTNEAKEDALIIPHPSEATDRNDAEMKFVCESDPAALTVEELRASGILRDHRNSFFSSTKNVCSGQEFITWLMKEKNINSTISALYGGLTGFPLNAAFEISLLMLDGLVCDSLNDSSESTALNAGPTQNYVLDNAAQLSETLRKLLLQLTTNHISEDSKVINYKELKDSEGFKEYVKLSQELQRVPVEKLDQDGRKAFFINVYNALVIHSTVENGPPSNWLSRIKFFDKTSYIIGGHSYSLNDIENGVLRANKRGPVQLFPPFGKSDPRRVIYLIQVDPRIHFALNCGARSCPPIKTFSAENINEELQVATQAYLETDEALWVDEEHSIVHLSSLLRWYSSDFGDNTEDVLMWVFRNVAVPKKKEALGKVINSKKYKVTYISYDWSTNASE
nr:uncharacterized protein LOC128687761 [Cherax quadricarinatus]